MKDFIRTGIREFKEHELREIVAVFCKLPGIMPEPELTGLQEELILMSFHNGPQKCTCGGGPNQPADEHDISCPKAIEPRGPVGGSKE